MHPVGNSSGNSFPGPGSPGYQSVDHLFVEDEETARELLRQQQQQAVALLRQQQEEEYRQRLLQAQAAANNNNNTNVNRSPLGGGVTRQPTLATIPESVSRGESGSYFSQNSSYLSQHSNDDSMDYSTPVRNSILHASSGTTDASNLNTPTEESILVSGNSNNTSPAIEPSQSPVPSNLRAPTLLLLSSHYGHNVNPHNIENSISGDSSSTTSSTFSMSLNQWHKHPPIVFIFHACILIFLAGMSQGAAIGSWSGHRGSLQLMRAGSIIEYQTILLDFFAGTSSADSSTSNSMYGDDGQKELNCEILEYSLTQECIDAAMNALLYARIVQSVRVVFYLLSCACVGRISDSIGRQLLLILATILPLLPTTWLLVHVTSGFTLYPFLITLPFTALCPLPLILVIYLSDVIPIAPSREKQQRAAASLAAAQQARQRSSPLHQGLLDGNRPSSSLSNGASSVIHSSVSSSSVSSSSQSSSSQAAAAAAIVATTTPPHGGNVQSRRAGHFSPIPISSSSGSKHMYCCCIPSRTQFYTYSKVFYFTVLLSIFSLSIEGGMWISHSIHSVTENGQDTWCAAFMLILAAIQAIYVLFIPESLVPFHRLSFPTFNSSSTTSPSSGSATSPSSNSASSPRCGYFFPYFMCRLSYRIHRELLRSFRLIRWLSVQVACVFLTLGYFCAILIAFFVHHGANRTDGGFSAADFRELFSISLTIGACVFLVYGFLIQKYEFSLKRTLQILLATGLFGLVLMSFFIPMRHEFLYVVPIFFGLCGAFVPLLLAWLALQFDSSDQGKVLGYQYGLMFGSLNAGWIIGGVVYQYIMENPNVAIDEGLVFPQRILILPFVLLTLSLGVSNLVPSFLSHGERMKYIQARPAVEASQSRSLNQSISASASNYSQRSQLSAASASQGSLSNLHASSNSNPSRSGGYEDDERSLFAPPSQLLSQNSQSALLRQHSVPFLAHTDENDPTVSDLPTPADQRLGAKDVTQLRRDLQQPLL